MKYIYVLGYVMTTGNLDDGIAMSEFTESRQQAKKWKEDSDDPSAEVWCLVPMEDLYP